MSLNAASIGVLLVAYWDLVIQRAPFADAALTTQENGVDDFAACCVPGY